MRRDEWRMFLEDQRDNYGKLLFTVRELANVTEGSTGALNVELSRLRKHGTIERYAQGVYGLRQDMPPETLLPYLDVKAYVTGISALGRHQLITQVPTVISCFTNRRHNRSRIRNTPLGRFEFACVQPPIYDKPTGLAVAAPERALFDYVYMTRRSGADAQSLVTFRNLHGLREAEILAIAERYPRTVRRQVSNILLREKSGRDLRPAEGTPRQARGSPGRGEHRTLKAREDQTS